MSKNYFLLQAGSIYYPKSGTQDWIGTYLSEEAHSQVKTIWIDNEK